MYLKYTNLNHIFLTIEKDVNRTDRNNKFYEGLHNPGLILLHDILMTYCMYDFDLGKCCGTCAFVRRNVNSLYNYLQFAQ